MSGFGFSSHALKQSLVDYAEELEAKEETSGLVYLRALRDRCLASIESDTGGADYVSTSVNGQTFSREISVSGVDLLAAVSDAIREVNGEAVKITYPTFRNIVH